jgi:hypothetical protein
MFNSMNRMTKVKVAGSPVALAVGAIALALLTACGGSGSTPSSGRAPASATARARQVVISGAINKTYTPVEISAAKIMDRVGISLMEEFPCGAELRFPIDMQPGEYPIGEHMSVPLAEVIAQYSPDCGKDGSYLSSQGTLKLTASGGKYSGEFEFTAKHNRDQSKTIKVSGSFSDVALP